MRNCILNTELYSNKICDYRYINIKLDYEIRLNMLYENITEFIPVYTTIDVQIHRATATQTHKHT